MLRCEGAEMRASAGKGEVEMGREREGREEQKG